MGCSLVSGPERLKTNPDRLLEMASTASTAFASPVASSGQHPGDGFRQLPL